MRKIVLAAMAAYALTGCAKHNMHHKVYEFEETGRYGYYDSSSGLWYWMLMTNTLNQSPAGYSTSSWRAGPAPSKAEVEEAVEVPSRVSANLEEKPEEPTQVEEEPVENNKEGTSETTETNNESSTSETSVDSGSSGGDSGGSSE